MACAGRPAESPMGERFCASDAPLSNGRQRGRASSSTFNGLLPKLLRCERRVKRYVLEVLEVDILWPRWVARIGVTRATEACFLAADRQCTELPLLRLPRLVPEVVGCDPFVPRDLARVGWRGLAPFLPIGPRERPRLADSFFAPGSGARGIPRVARPAIRRVAAMRGTERGPRGTLPTRFLKGGLC